MAKKITYYKSEDKTDKNINDISDEKIVSDIVSDYNDAFRGKQEKEDLFIDCYQRYRSYIESSAQTTRSQLFIPESFMLVETVAPRMTAKTPTWKVLPRESSDISKADSVGELLTYQYDRQNIQMKLKDFVKQGLIYGTSFMKVGWDPDKEMPNAEPVDIADMFGCTESTDWQSGYIIHRFYKTKYDLKRSKIKYKNIDNIPMDDNGKPTYSNETMREERDAIQGIPFNPPKGKIEILEWWGWVEGEIRVRTIANRKYLIRDDKSPFAIDKYPFIVFYDQKVPFEKWGIGEIEPILDLQDEENTIRNQRIDEKNLSIHNMWVVSKNAGIDYSSLVSKPGGIILANDINGIKSLEKQNITSDSVTEINMIKSDIQNATGVNDYIRGGDTKGGTATEVTTKTQEANMRFAAKVDNLELALKELGEWFVALNAQFITAKTKIRITGKYGVEEKEIPLSDIKGQFDVDVETGSSLPANPDLRRQQLRELLQVIAPYLQSPNGIPDGLRELMRNIIQSYDLKNADEILKGADHPEVDRVMSQLDDTDFEDINPELVKQSIKKQLTSQGMMGAQQPEVLNQMPPMRTELPQSNIIG